MGARETSRLSHAKWDWPAAAAEANTQEAELRGAAATDRSSARPAPAQLPSKHPATAMPALPAVPAARKVEGGTTPPPGSGCCCAEASMRPAGCGRRREAAPLLPLDSLLLLLLLALLLPMALLRVVDD